ncbi:hypothetical protein SAMN02745166_05102 [Prosthecobacter debontii]|uniref:Restriction endonuclease type IV Mrr domain-containing protein n=1 Tax=Prosthecobacter debontii TaxID=48467 RepID=A0A1T4Z506_9BACT|nr:polymer-forming cytoskeletal protein [Prosthecobacter debontii]SKB09157.1 hypothetical protein SAMN02745166_05102 [Prosthecobacter debontii]
MLDPFVTLSEAGFSAQNGAGLIGPGIWTPELIVSLDWLRLAEVVRSIASHAGCELAGSRVLPDGSLLFGMIERPTTSHPQRALVKLSAWNEWGATSESVAHFAREVRTASRTRGILVAPAGFNSAAQLTAQEHRIEMVDAQALCAVLKSLPPERSDLFYTIATAGLHTTPSCPICLMKMERVDPASQNNPASIRVISERGLFAEPVICDLLDIAPGAEVEFLYPVQSRAMRVCGHAAGDFSCDGTVTIQAGGLLDGRIAAKAVNVLEGGELRGQFRILDAEKVEPFVQQPERWHWGCRNLEGKAECRDITFEPHG